MEDDFRIELTMCSWLAIGRQVDKGNYLCRRFSQCPLGDIVRTVKDHDEPESPSRHLRAHAPWHFHSFLRRFTQSLISAIINENLPTEQGRG